MSAPERIWIEHGDECPYFYEEDELHEVGSAVIEYLRADIAASQLAKKEVEQQAKDKEYWSTLEQCANLETELAEARAEEETWHKLYQQALDRENTVTAERDRLAARLSEYNRWPDPLQSPQAEAIRNGKIDMTEIVSLFDKMERELEQLRLMAGERDRLAADNARLRERENAAREFVKRHPALTLIDLAEFEAFLKIPETLDALAGKE